MRYSKEFGDLRTNLGSTSVQTLITEDDHVDIAGFLDTGSYYVSCGQGIGASESPVRKENRVIDSHRISPGKDVEGTVRPHTYYRNLAATLFFYFQCLFDGIFIHGIHDDRYTFAPEQLCF